MKKTKILSVLLALLMLLTLAACGGTEAPAEEAPTEAPAEEVPAEEAPAEEAPAEEAPAEEAGAVWGHSVAEADGIMDYDALKAGYETMAHATSQEGGYQKPTYEEVMDFFGGIHGMKSEGHWSESYHAYVWTTADESAYCLISFKVQPDGSETWASTNWNDNT